MRSVFSANVGTPWSDMDDDDLRVEIARGVSVEEAVFLCRTPDEVAIRAAIVCKGLSNKLIARTLNVAEGTIKAHLHAIYAKLSLQSRYELLVALDHSRSD